MHLAYLVKRHKLQKEDVFNFDESLIMRQLLGIMKTVMVIGSVGAKHVERNRSDMIVCPKQCLTFIPMVSCAGDKLGPAMIFKGKGV